MCNIFALVSSLFASICQKDAYLKTLDEEFSSDGGDCEEIAFALSVIAKATGVQQ